MTSLVAWLALAILLAYIGLLLVPAELVALLTRDPQRRRTALRILTLLLAPLSGRTHGKLRNSQAPEPSRPAGGRRRPENRKN